jgi:hypothetical protein
MRKTFCVDARHKFHEILLRASKHNRSHPTPCKHLQSTTAYNEEEEGGKKNLRRVETKEVDCAGGKFHRRRS